MSSDEGKKTSRVFDPDLMLMVEEVELSEETAKEVLLEIAEYLGRGEALPIGVSEWLAGAIEGALNSPVKYVNSNNLNNNDVGKALLIALGLHSKYNRPSAHDESVFSFMSDYIDNYGCSQTSAAKIAAKQFSISVSKAQRSYKKITEVLKAAGLIPD